jgi:hypothetical protein
MLDLINNQVLTSDLEFEVKKIKEKLIDNRIIVIPKTLGKGHLYISQKL